jgi:hypothetical protein
VPPFYLRYLDEPASAICEASSEPTGAKRTGRTDAAHLSELVRDAIRELPRIKSKRQIDVA